MTIYGYARTSRPQQSIDRQIRNIKACNANAVIIQEALLPGRKWIALNGSGYIQESVKGILSFLTLFLG